MGSAIGNLLTIGLGIAISPTPIAAEIRALLAPHARANSLCFLAGWLAGTGSGLIVFTLLSSILPRRDPGQTRPIAAIISIVIGAVLLILAIRQGVSRPDGDATQQMPPWTSLTPLNELRTGFVQSVFLPTNLLVCVAAGAVLGTAALTVGQTIVAAAVFTVTASFTLWVPTVIYLLTPQVTARPLGAMRDWTLRNKTGTRNLVLLILGVFLIGNGIGRF